MKHPKMVEWDQTKRGLTFNKEMDGLFNVGADFTSGYGSRYGRGYIVQIHLSTLEIIPQEIRRKIEQEVEDLVNQKLPEKFPGRKLHVERDGNQLKIIGDMSLGSVIRA